MKNQTYFIGSCAFFIAAAIFVWSLNAVVSSRANTGSLSASAQATPSNETMLKYNRPLPVEQWDAF